jgi:tetratricopeptide (TPR) repeat protein
MKRWRVLAFVLLAIGALGLALSVLPGTPEDPRSKHARDMKLREIDERFRQGTAMLHARRYEHALTAFHRVLELDPALPEAHVNAGFALLGMKEYAKAQAFFGTAIELRPKQANAYFGLAVAADALGDRPMARGAMRTYLHLAARDDPYRRKAEAALWEWGAS